MHCLEFLRIYFDRKSAATYDRIYYKIYRWNLSDIRNKDISFPHHHLKNLQPSIAVDRAEDTNTYRRFVVKKKTDIE